MSHTAVKHIGARSFKKLATINKMSHLNAAYKNANLLRGIQGFLQNGWEAGMAGVCCADHGGGQSLNLHW